MHLSLNYTSNLTDSYYQMPWDLHINFNSHKVSNLNRRVPYPRMNISLVKGRAQWDQMGK
jgi:hypothetical protein